MIYYHHEQKEKMLSNPCNKKLDAVLQKNFPENDKWGACVYFEEDDVTIGFIEICKLTDASINGATWTHFCNIQNTGDGTWEVNTQFNGKLEDEMWIYGYYKYFKVACHCAASESFLNKTRKPIKIYI